MSNEMPSTRDKTLEVSTEAAFSNYTIYRNLKSFLQRTPGRLTSDPTNPKKDSCDMLTKETFAARTGSLYYVSGLIPSCIMTDRSRL
jgi:hypothetical protein